MSQFNLQLVLQLILYFAFGHIYTQQVYPRIIGGEVVLERKYNYYVRLHSRGKSYCGGSLLRNNAVLTAAHCVLGINVNMLRIHADTIDLADAGVVRRIRKALFPREFNATTRDYDVAVLILDFPIPRFRFTAISLEKREVPVGTSCLVIGHGHTKQGGVASQQLREVYVPVINHDVCERSYRDTEEVITVYMLCASVPGKNDSCAGDSGGPMICNGKQAGIVSWGMGCGSAKYPGVYTDISMVYNFIERALRHFP